ncbi:MAG: methyltransferase domain-containing protein [Anaerolineales bacterium]
MRLTPLDWHRRFTQQAQWTRDTRQHLFNRAGVFDSERVLDVGCGTGALTAQLATTSIQHVVGIDINSEFLLLAASNISRGDLITADGHSLPIKRGIFDCSFCHYLLMWVADPLSVIQEMKRVTKPGGTVLVLAEPDYGGRIDHPQELQVLNQLQTNALIKQGADPLFGRKIKGLFHQAGLIEIEVGVIGAQWDDQPSQRELSSEWEIILHDMDTLEKSASEYIQNSKALKEIDLNAWAKGERVLYVPTFNAFGRVPE